MCAEDSTRSTMRQEPSVGTGEKPLAGRILLWEIRGKSGGQVCLTTLLN